MICDPVMVLLMVHKEEDVMNFMSVREFRVNTGRMRKNLDRNEEVILTANGKPFAIVSAVKSELFDKELRAIRSARAKVALEQIRDSAVCSGSADMSMSEIDEVIAEARSEKVSA